MISLALPMRKQSLYGFAVACTCLVCFALPLTLGGTLAGLYVTMAACPIALVTMLWFRRTLLVLWPVDRINRGVATPPVTSVLRPRASE